MARPDHSSTNAMPEPGDRVEPAGALCEKWYSYLGLRLRLQHGELPDARATALFPGKV
ncbi:hypothetical protein [Labedaea rhizosphaerae]|nr:hypothetical protein [Labedaea rhizosphaerae]